MRKDMQRVIITPPRKQYRGTPQFSRSRRKGDDALTEPMSRNRGTKGLTDQRSPIVRYLDRACGRPWDDVWSEICAVSDARTVIGRHLRTHILEYILRKPRPGVEGMAWHDYYVDAEGILRATGSGPCVLGHREPPPAGVPTRDAGDGGRHEQHGGIWYYVRDAVVRARPAPHAPDQTLPETVVAAIKRQLDSRSLRRLGLRNERPGV